MDDLDIAIAIAMAEPKHLGQPTSPPLDWHRHGTDMIVVLADGRKIIRPIPDMTIQLAPPPYKPVRKTPTSDARSSPSSVVGRPSSLTPEFKPIRKPSPPPTKKGPATT